MSVAAVVVAAAAAAAAVVVVLSPLNLPPFPPCPNPLPLYPRPPRLPHGRRPQLFERVLCNV
eukprot:2477555-Pleurochrysis_carterae.AAC.1